MKRFLIFLLTISVLLSCKITQKGQTETGDAKPAINTYNYNYEKMAFDNSAGPKVRFIFNFNLNKLEGNTKIEKLIQKLVYNDMEPEAYVRFREKSAIGELKEEDYPPVLDNGKERIYESEYIESVIITNFNASFITVQRDYYSYNSGDAHGNPQINYYIVDINGEKILNTDDMITVIPEDVLKAAIKQKFNIEFDYRESVWPPDAISFDKSGLLLLWNVYSIAPYSTGSIEIILPYAEVNNYLTKKGAAIKESLN
jgi:hypothetical protein